MLSAAILIIRLLFLLFGRYPCYSAVILVISGCYPCYIRLLSLLYPTVILCHLTYPLLYGCNPDIIRMLSCCDPYIFCCYPAVVLRFPVVILVIRLLLLSCHQFPPVVSYYPWKNATGNDFIYVDIMFVWLKILGNSILELVHLFQIELKTHF